jgi:hypothetical protein
MASDEKNKREEDYKKELEEWRNLKSGKKISIERKKALDEIKKTYSAVFQQ